MVELISLRLTKEHSMSNVIQLYIGYSKDIINATGGARHLENYTSNYIRYYSGDCGVFANFIECSFNYFS